MQALLEYVESHSSTIHTFWFRPKKPVNNVPGQFTELYLPHKNPDNRGQKRWFTIYSSPTEELVAITTKIVPESSSYKKALQAITPGTELQFAEPMGDFILPVDKTIPLVFVAGGIGVTPFRSIVRWLQDKGESRDIQLLYAARNESELVERPLFDKLQTQYMLSQPSPTWSGLTGQLTADKIQEPTAISPETHVYLSGPEKMVEGLTKDLITKGLPKHQVITDYFPGYGGL